MNVKRLMSGFMACVLLALVLYVPVSYAGDPSCSLTVAVKGKGVEVFSSAAARKPSGTLYNGYKNRANPAEKSKRYEVNLTEEYRVYLDIDQAEELLPRAYVKLNSWEDEYIEACLSMQCSGFEAEVCAEETQLYLSPEGEKTSMTCYQGTRTVVWGEFGGRYFVDDYGMTGFIDKKDLSKVADLSFWDAYEARNERGYEERFEEKTVFTDGGHIYLKDFGKYFLEDGDKVRVRAYTGNGMVQLYRPGYVEARFLDPEGDHSTNNVYAVVKTDSPVNRLRIEAPVSYVRSRKLCSGVRVEVLDEDEKTADLYLAGSGRDTWDTQVFGTVKKEYLAFGNDAEKVENGCTRVTLTEDYKELWIDLPAGSILTVVGCEEANQAGDPDRLLVMTEDGKLITLINREGILEPIDPTVYQAKATSNVVFREKPNKDGKQIRTIIKGTEMEVLLRGECWTMIRYNKKTGYVMSRYLKFLQ